MSQSVISKMPIGYRLLLLLKFFCSSLLLGGSYVFLAFAREHQEENGPVSFWTSIQNTAISVHTLYILLLSLVVGVWYVRRRAKNQQLLAAHEQIKFREQRLQLALTGSNSEVWDWLSAENLMLGKRVTVDLDFPKATMFYRFDEHVNFIHPDDQQVFLTSWQLFIDNADVDATFSCIYRLKGAEEQWLWYKDTGKIVATNTLGEPTRITGTYTNITQSRADEERTQYYGDAFKLTKDWVLIIDENLNQVTANQSLRDVFGWESEEFEFEPNALGISAKRLSFYRKLFSTLEEHDHWRGEELIATKNAQEYHVIINISVSKNQSCNRLHYILVLTDITAQKTAEKELRYLANYDHLTELPNRALLLDRIKHAIDYSKRKKDSIALFSIDLDRFKQINDSLRHECDDLLLQEISARLTGILRGDDTVARIGGDEFVVLLESFRSSSHLGRIAEKVIRVVEQPIKLKNNVVSIGASIGIALYPEDAKNSTELLRNADVAMYHAKQIGRNTFQFFTPRMNFEAKERLRKESKLKLAVTNNELVNHYQPIVDAFTGKAIGVELLMRWKSEDGLVPPMDFIPVAEELGLIIPMTEAVLSQGLADLKRWHAIRPGIFLSVNLSPQHFAKNNLLPYVKKLLDEHNIAAELLKLEITESAFISEPQKAIRTMNALSKLGVKLALDDFGTGYSSLSYLKQMPLNIIKIDASFVAGIGQDKTDEAIVDATLVLAKNLNMVCIAEGVETKEQMLYLVDRRCHLIQGFLYSKPVDVDTLLKMLMVNNMEVTAPELEYG